MAANSYSLTFGEGNKNFSLTINGTSLITEQTTVPTKISLLTLFNSHGYGELMAGTTDKFCATAASYQAAFEAFVAIAVALKTVPSAPRTLKK